MSKLIVEMPMPKNCWLCNLAYLSDDYNDERGAYMIAICKADKQERTVDENETERPSWCPIKGELPDEHGRLIDADAYQYYGDLVDEPTIVPSTKKEGFR